MDTNIIVRFFPFVRQQEIMVYQNGECIKTLHPFMENVVDTVKGLKSEYKVNQINLCGNRAFSGKFAQKLSTDFDRTMINIIEH